MNFEKLIRQSLIWRGFYFVAVLVLNIVLSRYLQAAGAGWVYFLTNLYSLVVLVSSLSLESGLAFFAASQKNILKQALGWFAMLFAMVVSVLLLPMSKIYFTYYPLHDVPSKNTVLFGGYYTLGIMLVNFFSVLFYAEKDYSTPNIVLGLLNYFLAGYIFCLQRSNAPTEWAISIYFIFFIAQGAVLAVVFLIKYNLLLSFQLPSFLQAKELLRYSALALAANFVFFLVYRIDFWFVEQYRSQAELGNYIQASKMGQMLLIIPQILASVVLPQTAEGLNKIVIQHNILAISRLLMQFFLVLGIFSFFFGEKIFSAVFGNSFHTMYLPFLLLLPGMLALCILTLFSAYFGGTNKVYINMVGGLLALVFVILGNFCFTNQYGIVAAAMISSIGYTINLAYALYIFLGQEASFSIKDFFRWRMEDYKWVKGLFKK
ncbi:polysaccharide biosynthesis C-terminal domain-containing protein [Parasediminibacterium sp. JCM 36343]|uniref:polysaccharide biosynthesis C-terminal domain-containing protein n=1 Tax=Parasediminibacterium sp. JCM 36343 TaxID=3374279 RepID=UPI00397E8055